MEVSPKTLREVRFREKMTRGYHPEDVDIFLEQVAVGVEALQDRLRQAVDRAQRAESVAADSDGADATLRKTLVLAQRTADMAVAEAREQASRILASAEQQAQTILGEAEERGRRTLEETIAECKAELNRLEATRNQAQIDVDTLQRWLDEHKEHLRNNLTDALAAIDRAGVLWPAPSSRPIDTGVRRPLTTGSPFEPTNGHGGEAGPDTVLWSPEDKAKSPEAAAPSRPVEKAESLPAPVPPAPPAPVSPPAAAAAGPGGDQVDPDQQAMDDFFEDSGELEEEPRFGGRLRRRR